MSNTEDVGSLNRKFIKVLQDTSSVRLSGIEIIIETLHCTFNNQNFKTGWHQHPFFELSIMKKGPMKYEFSANEVILSEAENLVFIPPNVNHQRSTIDISSIILGFQIQIKALTPAFSAFVSSMPSKLKNASYLFEGSSELLKIMHDLFKELIEEKPLYISKVNLLTKDFLLCFFRDNFYSSIEFCEERDKDLVQKSDYYEYLVLLTERFIEENRGRQISIDEIAAYCAVSKRHLNRIFHNNKGISLGDYVIDKKIEYAIQKLIQNNSLVKDVAYELGFGSTAYFCRLFKKKTGKTPDEYRRGR